MLNCPIHNKKKKNANAEFTLSLCTINILIDRLIALISVYTK